MSRSEQIIDDAIAAGKFPESRREHYRGLYDLDPRGTERVIASLESVPILAALAPDPGHELSIAQTLFPELRLPRPLRYGGSPAPAPERVAASQPAPVAAQSRSEQPADTTATAAEEPIVLHPEVVAAWTRKLFQEITEQDSNPSPQIVWAND